MSKILLDPGKCACWIARLIRESKLFLCQLKFGTKKTLPLSTVQSIHHLKNHNGNTNETDFWWNIVIVVLYRIMCFEPLQPRRKGVM